MEQIRDIIVIQFQRMDIFVDNFTITHINLDG